MIKKPSELDPDLTDERIDLIGHLIARVRLENIESADERDDGWSLGCRAYKWCCSEIDNLSATTPWINIINPTLKFIFTIGNVEVSFYKGASENPKKNIYNRAISHPELRQLTFPTGFEVPDKLVWAFAIETNAEGLTTNIDFVAMSETGNVIASHNVPLHNIVSNLVAINNLENHPPANLAAAPVSLPSIEKDNTINK